MEKSELEKARIYLANRRCTYKELAKKSGLSVEMLKKFSENPKRLERGYYKNIHALSELYDQEYKDYEINLLNPKKIAKLHKWLETKLPKDSIGKNLKELIINNTDIYYKMLSKVDEGDGKNGI